jgi:hypothetical protein
MALRMAASYPAKRSAPAGHYFGAMFPIILAAVLCGDLCSDEAFRQYGFLLASSGFGRGDAERGAFLVHDERGIRLIVWPPGRRDSATYSGRMPDDVVAIVHTHPHNLRDPSYGDVRVAMRLGLPNIVLTPNAVSVAWPDGTVSYLTEQMGWPGVRRAAFRSPNGRRAGSPPTAGRMPALR